MIHFGFSFCSILFSVTYLTFYEYYTKNPNFSQILWMVKFYDPPQRKTAAPIRMRRPNVDDLFFDFTVGAVNYIVAGTVIPVSLLFYCIPPFLCFAEVDFGYVFATNERSKTNGGNAFRNSHTGQAGAFIECIPTNGSDAVRDGDRGHICATRECAFCNYLGVIMDRICTKVFFIGCHQNKIWIVGITKILAVFGRCILHAAATYKHRTVNSGDAIRDVHTHQAAAICERPTSNSGDTIRNGHIR
jgi:hypothetical protein